MTQNGVGILRVKNILGALTAVGTYPSKLIEAAETLFNPVTLRSQSQRAMFSRLQTFAYEADVTTNVNPYIYLLGADVNNIGVVSNFLSTMGNHIKSELNCKTN